LPLRLLSKLNRFDELSAIKQVADYLDLPVIDLVAPFVKENLEVQRFKEKLDVQLCWAKKIVPLWIEEDGRIGVAMANPFDLDSLNTLSFLLNGKAKQYIAEERKIVAVLKDSLPPSRVEFDTVIVEDDDNSSVEILGADRKEQEAGQKQVETKPVIRLCNRIVAEARQKGASDIHLEPIDGALDVRFRIDGVMHSIMEIPQKLQPAVISRLKLLAGMDIADHRRPQDGRFGVKIDGLPLDVRVSCIPSSFGENLVLRLLNNDSADFTFAGLGLKQTQAGRIKSILDSRGKMFLVTGPTGSGKTTTLYTCLNHLRNGTLKIATVEDPIEYRVPGVQQIQVNESAGITFASALRSLLRQDPDVLMLGEIRDEETSKIALQAAQTGHLVLSTLHTNDAPSAITRLLHLGAPSYLVASGLAGIVAQRLVRKICPNCKSIPGPEFFTTYASRLSQYQVKSENLAVGAGCEACAYTGYKGRIAVYSYLEVTDEISQLAHEQAPTHKILEEARKSPYFQTLDEHAIELVESGLTTLMDVEPYLELDTKQVNKKVKVSTSAVQNASELFNEDIEHEEPVAETISKEKILIVEDDEDLRCILSMLLEKEMYEVYQAENGLAGLKQVYEKRPSLVVADLMMPQMDGKEFLLKMKGNPKTKDIPILMLTAANSEENEVELIDLGANDFVRKGASSSVFLSRVRRALVG
jgi:type IV pilus assembly protein PilB